jgi:HAD superfamily hydrolase (TIGR01509 family)
LHGFDSRIHWRWLQSSVVVARVSRAGKLQAVRLPLQFSACLLPQNSMLSAIIFDLDGLLADSEPWWNQVDAKLLAEYAVTYRGEYHQNVLGVSYRLAVEFYKKAFGLSVPTDEMMRRRGEIATEFFANRIGLFPNVKEVLEELRQMKLRLAVATSSVGASARPFLDRHQLTGFFDVIVTGEEVECGKPAPDIYLRAADKLGIHADACLVAEDALPGVAAAKAASMRVAAIPDTRFVDLREYEKKADYVLNSLKKLPALVRKLVVAK